MCLDPSTDGWPDLHPGTWANQQRDVLQADSRFSGEFEQLHIPFRHASEKRLYRSSWCDLIGSIDNSQRSDLGG
jgi:hypothetical protein